MFNVHCRLAAALSTLATVLLVTAMPARASAQVADVTDTPLAFKNSTDRDLAFELISVLQRNGQEVPIKATYHFKPGQYMWLEFNKKKIPAVTCTFVVRTPAPIAPLLGEKGPVGYEYASAWTIHSQGNAQHFTVDFTKDQLEHHLKSSLPYLVGSAGPAIPSAAERKCQFLQQQIDRVKAAIQQDEALIQKVGLGGDFLRILGNEADKAAKNRGQPGDELWGYLAKRLGEEAAKQAAQDIAAAQARIKVNRELLLRYEQELKLASLPKL
jgi:hypothetical protein